MRANVKRRNLEKYLAAYADGEVRSGWFRYVLEKHLRRCPLCQKALQAQRWVKSVLKGLRKVKASPELENKIREKLSRLYNPQGGD